MLYGAWLQTGANPGTLVLWASVALLLFLLNRSMRNQALRKPEASKDCLKARVSIAKLEIAQIDASNWVDKHNAATRIPRRALSLDAAELESLRRITDRQSLAGIN